MQKGFGGYLMEKLKGLTAGKLILMALGSVVGGSFFIGYSIAINAAGPGVIISYILSGVIVYFILFTLSEMTVVNLDSGSFRTFAEDEYGPAMGFIDNSYSFYYACIYVIITVFKLCLTCRGI